MPLFETHPVERAEVASLLGRHWGLQLDDGVLKASQNHTFAARDASSGARFAVRVTPDPEGKHAARVADELAFVAFLGAPSQLGDTVCAPVAPRDAPEGSPPRAVRAGALIVCVSPWAEGAPLDFGAYRWLTDEVLIAEWGAWLARLHACSRAFAVAQPQRAARMQRWDDLHGGLMRGSPVAAADAADVDDPSRYGLLHGDLNLSNFYVVDAPSAPPALRVFDWDQACRGWWELDLAQAALTSLMLAEGGSLPAGDPVPQADPAAFMAALVLGYERVAGAGAVDRKRLARMTAGRKRFYATFCAQAAKEGAPPDMAWFIDYVNRWLAKAPPAEA